MWVLVSNKDLSEIRNAMSWVKTFQIAKVNTDKTSVTRVIPKTIHCLIFAFAPERRTRSIQTGRNLSDVRDLKNVRCLRADVSNYRPEVYKSENTKVRKKNSQSSTRQAININVIFTSIR